MVNQEYSRVLYADDNEDSCLMVGVLLEISGIEITAARSVAEAWRLAQTEHFDLYLLDVRFPDGDGLELCRILREYDQHTPILFYSGNAYEADKQKGLAAGANAYLTKPYVNNLADTIKSAIRISRKTYAGSWDNFYPESQNYIN
ncbi:MAG TPA: response regulator [Pyrinomonadaceae bacterium]|nr:response regulator [Pyrinomonadaceae bacterium]